MINLQIKENAQVFIWKGYSSLKFDLRMFGCICYLKKKILSFSFKLIKVRTYATKQVIRGAIGAHSKLSLSIHLSNQLHLSLSPHW